MVVVGDTSECFNGAAQASGKLEDVRIGDVVIDTTTISSREGMLLHHAVVTQFVDLHHLVEHVAVETFLEVGSGE